MAKGTLVKKADPVFIVYADYGDRYCVLDGLQNVEDDYEISKGISRAKDFPADACFRMSNQHKKHVALSDGLHVLGRQLVVSPRLKAFIEARNPPKVEYLKVTILNHKGKPIPETYHIVNPLAVVDCIDTKKSKLEWNAIDEELICGVYKLVLKTDAIDPNLLLFRPKHLEHRVFIQRAFGEEMRAAGFTALRFKEPSTWIGA